MTIINQRKYFVKKILNGFGLALLPDPIVSCYWDIPRALMKQPTVERSKEIWMYS